MHAGRDRIARTDEALTLPTWALPAQPGGRMAHGQEDGAGGEGANPSPQLQTHLVGKGPNDSEVESPSLRQALRSETSTLKAV